MTAHCATCNCADDDRPPQPATSSAWARYYGVAEQRLRALLTGQATDDAPQTALDFGGAA